MKYLLTTLILTWALTVNAQNHLNPIEKLLADKVQPLRTVESQKTVLNVGKISGQLFDKDTEELISNDINFNVNLFKKHPRFDDWVYMEGIDSENPAFEFNHLEHGQYLISVSRRGFYSDLAVLANEAYLHSVWSASGNHTCINCVLNSDRIITIDSNQTEVQADFELEKGGILAVSLDNDNLEQSDNFSIVAINENNQIFDNSIQSTRISGIGTPPFTSSTQIKAISILPSGQYRFYTQTYQFIDKSNEGVPCEYCEFNLSQQNTSELSVYKGQTTEVEISLTKPNSSLSGEVAASEPFDRGRVQLTNYNYNNQLVDIFDQSLEFFIAGIKSGIYFLNQSIGADFHYDNLYGGSHCWRLNCDPSDATPILVGPNQDIRIKPDSFSLGGVICGSVKGSEDTYVLDNPYSNNEFGVEYFEFYDENLKQISQVDVAAFADLQNNLIEYKLSLPAGRYYVKTGSSRNGKSNRNYIDQIYPNINCAGFYCDFSDAELITVEVGETVSDINFNLEPGFGIRGKVIDSNDGKEIKDINILVYDEAFNFLGATLTDDSGDYGFFNLPNGDYYVSTANGSQSFKVEYEYPTTHGFKDQLYPNVPCPNGRCDLTLGQKVTVQDSDVSAIDFQLSSGHSLSGTVTDSKTGQPIEHLSVAVYHVDGTHIADYKTNQLGSYVTGALQADEYLIKTQAHNLYPEFVLGYGTCLYGDCEVSAGAAFSFSDNQTVDFELSHKKDIYAALSGNWYQPDESGHGLQFEVISQNDASHLYVTWFAHLNGKQIWLSGTGLLLGDKAYVDLNITDGSDFPADNNIKHWGNLRVNFSDLNHAKASWQPVLDGFSAGELDIERLTVLSSEFSTNDNIGACFSGSYYDAERDGEGMVIEVLGNPTDRLLMTWYSYRGDEQFWMLGSGALNGNQATIPVHYTEGSSFTPDFDSGDLAQIIWGEVVIKKVSNGSINVAFKPNQAHADFETKETQLNKLTEIHTLRCPGS